MSKVAAEYIKSRSAKTAASRFKSIRRVETWRAKFISDGWRACTDMAFLKFAERLRFIPKKPPRSDLEEGEELWLPGWLFDLYAGDTSQALHLLPKHMQQGSEESRYVDVVQAALRTSERRAQHPRYLYWLKLKNLEEESGP